MISKHFRNAVRNVRAFVMNGDTLHKVYHGLQAPALVGTFMVVEATQALAYERYFGVDPEIIEDYYAEVLAHGQDAGLRAMVSVILTRGKDDRYTKAIVFPAVKLGERVQHAVDIRRAIDVACDFDFEFEYATSARID